MEQYKELEEAILNCLIIKPELFKTTKLNEKHFKKHKRFYVFIKKFYDTFGNFDLSLLKSACSNPGEVMDYIADIINTTSVTGNFELYERRLLKLYDNFEEIENIHKLEKRLYFREIDIDEFKKELKQILGEE